MKYCRFALLLTMALTADLSSGAQALPAGAVMMASEGAPGGDGLFPLLRSATQERLNLHPALSEGLKAPDAAAPAPLEPLTARDRLVLFWNESYATPGLWAGVAAGAIIDQVRHTPLKWDRDGNGYTRRFASEYGQLATRNAIHEGLAGVTGLDPRYVACVCQGAMRRSAHALVRSFSNARQNGRSTLDVPSVASAYGAGMVSTLWYPHQQFSPLVQGVQFGHEQMGEIVLGNLVQEFRPDIQRRLHLHAFTARRLANPDDDD